MIVFFGSGVSTPAGLPKVEDITKEILFGEWTRTTRSHIYEPCNGFNNIRENDVPKIQTCLQYLYNQDSSKTYENLFQDLYDIGKNRNLFQGANIEHAISFIECVVADLLVYSKKESKIPGFELLLDLIANEKIDVVTLNHDILVEKYFNYNEIRYSDGFVDSGVVNVKYTDGIHIIKLHGSISWHFFGDMKYICKTDESIYKMVLKTGEIPFPKISEFLTGKKEKENKYGESPYKKIFIRFKEVLKENSTIVMSGYGWNDDKINKYLKKWLEIDSMNIIILFHNDKIPDYVRNSIKMKSIIHIDKWFCDGELNDIISHIIRDHPYNKQLEQ